MRPPISMSLGGRKRAVQPSRDRPAATPSQIRRVAVPRSPGSDLRSMHDIPGQHARAHVDRAAARHAVHDLDAALPAMLRDRRPRPDAGCAPAARTPDSDGSAWYPAPRRPHAAPPAPPSWRRSSARASAPCRGCGWAMSCVGHGLDLDAAAQRVEEVALVEDHAVLGDLGFQLVQAQARRRVVDRAAVAPPWSGRTRRRPSSGRSRRTSS